MLLVNLFLGCSFFLELQWYLQHIYRFAPWIPFISLEQIDTAIDLLWGAFMLHVGAPLARGRLEILRDPARFLGEDAFGLFCHRRTAAVISILVAGVFALIVFSPALHLIHTTGEERPVVEIDGSRRDFQGTSIPLLGDDMRIGQAEIVVTGKHRFYRVAIQPADFDSYWPFPTHKRVNLDRFFLRRDLAVTLNDANNRELASLNFDYQQESGIASQCNESKLQLHFGEDPAGCVSLLRRIVADMSGNPEARLLNDFSGAVQYRRRMYDYIYTFGPELGLSIRAPEAESELANNPREALVMFRSADAQERALLVSEFSKDVGSLSSTALEQVFQGLFESNNLFDYLNGTTSQKMDTLSFARDILALGVDHVLHKTVNDLVVRILDGNLVQSSDDKVFVPAIDALIALTHSTSSLRSMILGKVDGFVSELGTHHNSAKPAIARILLQALGDQASSAEEDRIVSTLVTLRRNATGVDVVVQQIQSHLRARLSQLSNPSLARRLREAMSADHTTIDSNVEISEVVSQ